MFQCEEFQSLMCDAITLHSVVLLRRSEILIYWGHKCVFSFKQHVQRHGTHGNFPIQNVSNILWLY